MKAFLAILFISLSPFLTAQSCVFEKNEVDKFTGKTTIHTQSQRIRTKGIYANYATLKYVIIDTVAYLAIDYQSNAAGRIPKGAELNIITQSGAKMVLNAELSSPSRRLTSGRLAIHELKGTYAITRDQLKTLANDPIKDFRVNQTERIADFEIFKPRWTEGLTAITLCAIYTLKQ